MNTDTIRYGLTPAEKLNRLAELQAQGDAIRARFNDIRAKIITPEIQAALDEVAAEEQTALEALNSGIEAITAEIKAAVIRAGETVNGDYLQAVYSKGRVTWDSKRLDGYAAAHPEVIQFRKEGEPSVSIRARK